jgi:hypothetical protein
MICAVGGRAERCTALFATALFATALFATALFAGARRSVRSKRCPGPRQLPVNIAWAARDPDFCVCKTGCRAREIRCD